MPKVSVYPHIKETKKSESLELSDIFNFIKSDEWKDEITEIRNMVALAQDEKDISKAKNLLPYFTGSGIFNVRNDNGLVQHSGRIIIDFDKLADIAGIRTILISDIYSEYVFYSCTGRGLAVSVKIDGTKHLDSFLFLENYYLSKYGLQIDKACKDLSRPRFVSYDPDLFHNPHSAFVDLSNGADTFRHKIIAPVGIDFDDSISIDTDEGKYEWCLAVHNKKEQYIEGNRHNWLNIFVFFLNKAGVSYSYARNRILADYAPADKPVKEIESQIDNAYKRGIDEHGTFKINKSYQDMPPEYVKSTKQVYKIASTQNQEGREYTDKDIKDTAKIYDLPIDIVENIFKSVFTKNTDEFDILNKPEIVRVENFIKKRWEIYHNEVTHRVQGRRSESDQGLKLVNVDQIYREMSHAGFKFALDKLKSLLRSEFVATYNPFLAYFSSLQPWDGTTDHITALAAHISTTNDEFWREQFKKSLVRSIACSLGGKINRIIMTLVGEEEETGKSTFIEFLCPPQLKEYYNESALDTSKDSDIALSENFIWNLEELAVLNAIEINRLKAIISKISIKQRAAYKEFAEVNPRRVNFWAATNKIDFLTDDQNTRWLCFTVKSVNFDYNNSATKVKNIDINQVWAQAWSLYNSGFDFRLSKKEAAQRSDFNKDYESTSFEKEVIMRYYKPAEHPYGKFMANSDLLLALIGLTENKHKFNIYAIARAMKSLGYIRANKRIGGKLMRGYMVQDRGVFDVGDERIIPDVYTSKKL